MRMEAWVGERWVLIGEHFAPKKSDRIVVSPPPFRSIRYRLRFSTDVGSVDERRLPLPTPTPKQRPNVQFIGSCARWVTVEYSTVARWSSVLWHVENRNYNQQPVIEQVAMPSGEIIAAPLNDLQSWLPRQDERSIRLSPVDGDTVFLRLRIVDTVSNQTLIENLITLPVVAHPRDDLASSVSALPPFDAAILGHVRQIYTDGQAQGNTPYSFMKIGDSNIAGDSALCIQR